MCVLSVRIDFLKFIFYLKFFDREKENVCWSMCRGMGRGRRRILSRLYTYSRANMGAEPGVGAVLQLTTLRA